MQGLAGLGEAWGGGLRAAGVRTCGLTGGPGWGLGSWAANNWTQGGPPGGHVTAPELCAQVWAVGTTGDPVQEKGQWGSLWAPLHSGDVR